MICYHYINHKKGAKMLNFKETYVGELILDKWS